MVSTSSVVWTSFKPMIKIYALLFVGYYFGKKNVLEIRTSRNVYKVVKYVLRPCLVFSSIVTNLTYKDIKPIFISVLCELIYLAFSALCGLAVLACVKRFQWFQNWHFGATFAILFSAGPELVIAFLQSMEYNTRLFSQQEVSKSIAYTFIVTLIMDLAIYTYGWRFVPLDFKSKRFVDNSQTTCDSLEQANTESKTQNETANSRHSSASDDVASIGSSVQSSFTNEPVQSLHSEHTAKSHKTLSRTNTRNSGATSKLRAIELRKLPSQNIQDLVSEYQAPNEMDEEESLSSGPVQRTASRHTNDTKARSSLASVWNTLLKKPFISSILVSFGAAMIPWVQNLFVSANSAAHIKNAPDKYPPLNIFISYSSYLGQASVQLSLFLVGSFFARLDLRSLFAQKRKLYGALFVAILKMCIFPVVGVAWLSRIYNGSTWLSINDRGLLWVLCCCWGLPGASIHVYLTALKAGNSMVQVDWVSRYLVVEYALMIVTFPFISSVVCKVVLNV